MSAQKQNKNHAGSTQKFTQIQDIIEDVVLFDGGFACLIIEIQASNFALLSIQEQQAKIYAYASMLNSLSFAIQIIVQNKKIDISSYLQLLDQEIAKAQSVNSTMSSLQNQALIDYIRLYKDFIQELIKVNTVLDKKFYLVVPYSILEKGVGAVTSSSKKGKGIQSDLFINAKASLHTKANSLLNQLARLGLRAKVLGGEELVKLYYEIFNPEETTPGETQASIKTPIIRGAQPI